MVMGCELALNLLQHSLTLCKPKAYMLFWNSHISLIRDTRRYDGALRVACACVLGEYSWFGLVCAMLAHKVYALLYKISVQNFVQNICTQCPIRYCML